MSQRGFEIRILKLISGFRKFPRPYPLTDEQHFIGHLSERQPCRKRGYRHYRGPRQNLTERPRKLFVRYRIWRNNVQRSADRLVGERQFGRANHIINRYPAYKLFTRSNFAAHAHLEWR